MSPEDGGLPKRQSCWGWEGRKGCSGRQSLELRGPKGRGVRPWQGGEKSGVLRQEVGRPCAGKITGERWGREGADPAVDRSTEVESVLGPSECVCE